MFKPVLGLIATVVASAVFAQSADVPSEGASGREALAKVAAVAAVLGVLKERTESGDDTDDWCDLKSTSRLPRSSIVVVVRVWPCTPKYAGKRRDFFQVLYGGNTRLVPTDAVLLSAEHAKRLESLLPSEVEASAEEWRLTSLLARKTELEKALKALDATSKHGVALLKASIFDVSEYTEGTGFKATIYNPTKKIIKYVTFTVVGLNAVGDPVRGGFARSTAAPMLRGIGPIGPGETGTYSKDYMWTTDVVQSFRVSSIRLEYMDGSSKVVSDVKNVRVSAEDYETLSADDE